MRGNASRYPDKRLGRVDAEAQMVAYLCGVTRPLRAAITVDSLVARFNVTPKTAQYRLMLQQQRWAAE